MSIRHLRSHVLVGGYSASCRGGRGVLTDTPAKCLFPMPDGVDYVLADGERVGRNADCCVTNGACVHDAALDLPAGSNALDNVQGES